MRFAQSRELARFGEPVILDTPREYAELIERLVAAVRRAAGEEEIEGIAIGKPLWKKWPDFRGDVAEAIDAPVLFENDTALVGLGEVHFGAGRGSEICAYITVSTGVNGARIVDGHVDRSMQGFEIGGMYMNAEDTLESLVSGTAIRERFGVSSPKDLGAGHEVWEELAATLAFGVHNTILHWSPDRVVLGGSMFNEIGISVERVGDHVESLMEKFPYVPHIVHSALGDLGGLFGGMALLRQAEAS